jgi:hypothetical protein
MYLTYNNTVSCIVVRLLIDLCPVASSNACFMNCICDVYCRALQSNCEGVEVKAELKWFGQDLVKRSDETPSPWSFSPSLF